MFDDVKGMADQIGWPWAIGVTVLLLMHRAGLLTNKSTTDTAIVALSKDMETVKVQLARLETKLDERTSR